jgi:hypothetical protein
MNTNTIKTIAISTLHWIVLWGVFWVVALVWLHLSHGEVYDFFTAGTPGSLMTIDNSVFARFYTDRNIFIILTAGSSLFISQVALIISSFKK